MSVLDLPEAKSLVIGDTEGSLLRVENEADGESIAAVMGFMWNTIQEPGEMLGLGAPQYVTFKSPSQAYLVMNTRGNKLITLRLDPAGLNTQNQKLMIELSENEE